MKNGYIKRETKNKHLGCKRSFKVGSLTFLLFWFGFNKNMGVRRPHNVCVIFVANHEIEVYQLKVPSQMLRFEALFHHQIMPMCTSSIENKSIAGSIRRATIIIFNPKIKIQIDSFHGM